MEAAPIDYMVKLFRFWEIVAEKYMTELSPETRAICEAAAAGYNHYAALHPEKVLPGVLPATGQDIVTGFAAKTPFFFGVPGVVQRLFGKERPGGAEKLSDGTLDLLSRGLPVGSNTFAIAPSRTPDGKTHLAINSHQPWTGPAAWYEAHLKSEEGMDIVGGSFPGAPIILHGHNRNLGWAHTVNHPDLIDVYILEINPDNPLQYKFDGQWRDLKVGTVEINVKVLGNRTMTLNQRVRYSVHGPVIRQTHGTYAIRYAGYGNIRQVEQWYRMGKARNIDEFEQAMRIQAIPMFNVGYADKGGNIWYIYNALLPIRAEGYDWRGMLPGNTSKTLWTEYLPFEKLPQVRNPKSGFIQSCNSTPFKTTIGPENPRPEDYSKTFGIEPPSFMMNRSIRLLELLGADTSVTEEEFYAYKYDLKYSPASVGGAVFKELLRLPPSDDPAVQEAMAVLKRWDLSTDERNTSTAIAVLALEPVVRARMDGRKGPDLAETLKEKAHLLKKTFGRIDVPWERVNRLVRGKVDVGLGGGPEVLHAIYGKWTNGRLVGEAGDCYILMATWDHDGKVHSRSIHQFGSATLDETSPHYADQVPLFIKRQTKPVWLDESELRQHLEAEYRPGEPHGTKPGR
jgi:acyl-homoserine-lactone acylase